jgi:L-ascorbate metabolism protein UlaG (beta-lactamase superfamily)
MKTLKLSLLISLILIILLIGSKVHSQENKSCSVTYIGNDGFLVESGNYKILIDALFGGIKGNWCDQPDSITINNMINGVTPFDNISVLFITHKHLDHFNPEIISQFMLKNKSAYLICPSQVTDILKSIDAYSRYNDRLIDFNPGDFFDSSLVVNNIPFEVFRFRHSPYIITDTLTGEKYDRHKDIQNLGYLINLNGFKVFHSGDDSPENIELYNGYGISNKFVDVAFIDRMFLKPEGMKMLGNRLNAKKFIFMHVDPDRRDMYKSIIKNYSELYIFGYIKENLIISK